MAPISPEYLDDLKYILEHGLQAGQLDAHPWMASPILQEVSTDGTPAQRLVLAVSQCFRQMMPSTPPKRGKRLDTRWGEFGILAAMYFAPIQFGMPQPASLRDAWGRIDQSILLFALDKPPEEITSIERETYKLVGDEPEAAPSSTLSDWHRKGLLRLAETIQAREAYLAKSMPVAPNGVDASSGVPIPSKKKTGPTRKALWLVILFLLVLLAGILTVGGLKARRAYELALTLRQDAQDVRALMSKEASYSERMRAAGPLLEKVRVDFDALNAEVGPYLWITSHLGWVPTYGDDLVAAQDLVDLADALLLTADTSYQAAAPILEENERDGLDLARLTAELVQVQPQLQEAQRTLDLAVSARSRIATENLSPEVGGALVELDRFLPLAQDGLTLGRELPRLLGATQEGPKTYLLLVQNEDELRPTGGFITAAGTLLLQDGRMGSLEFSNSGNADDWTKPYPTAPWQLGEYMNSPVLIFRDANWFTHYPTTAQYAEYLYSLSSNHSVDGVIAFDQQLLVKLLAVTGPLRLADVDVPVDAGNVVSYMRASKTPTPEEAASPEWNNKAFLNKITRALLEKILSGDVEPEKLVLVLMQALNEHHLLIQVDNVTAAALLERYDWDGAVRPSGGDFLMVVDTNIGFNKTNAVVRSSLTYEVDLSKTNSLTSSLTVFHQNDSTGLDACHPWEKVRVEGEKEYPIQDCYWNYMRVYTPKGTFLLDAAPQAIPAEWMILKKSPPVQVDILDEEIEGVQGFGTIQVVPVSSALTTDFEFLLPPGVVQAQGNNRFRYHLKVQKQPGTAAVPITIRIQLPDGAVVITAPPGAEVEGTSILLQADLRLDLDIEVFYEIP